MRLVSTNKGNLICVGEGENGASEGIRTLDVHLGKVMLYQLSYARFLDERWASYENHGIKQAFVLAANPPG